MLRQDNTGDTLTLRQRPFASAQRNTGAEHRRSSVDATAKDQLRVRPISLGIHIDANLCLGDSYSPAFPPMLKEHA
jgi:hypothetical protein